MVTLASLRGTSSETRPPTRHAAGARDVRPMALGSELIPACDAAAPERSAAEPRAARETTGPSPWPDGDLAYVTAEDLRPVAVIVGALFAAFTVYHWLAFPPGVRTAVCVYDLAIVV